MKRLTVFAVLIGLKVEITEKILKKRLIFSEHIIEMVRLTYHFSKTEFRRFLSTPLASTA